MSLTFIGSIFRYGCEGEDDNYNEINDNNHDEIIVLNDAQVHAFKHVVKHYSVGKTDTQMFGTLIVDDSDIFDMSAFYYWGAWLSAAARIGETYSHTHNWYAFIFIYCTPFLMLLPKYK